MGGIITILILGILMFGIICIVYNKETKEIKGKYPKHRFEYIDLFYYFEDRGDIDDTDKKFYFWLLIKDLNTGKLHVIHESQMLAGGVQSIFGKITLKDSNHKSIEFGSQGDLWIKKEITEKINVYSFNPRLKPYEHVNKTSPTSLINEATAIRGRIMFDK